VGREGERSSSFGLGSSPGTTQGTVSGGTLVITETSIQANDAGAAFPELLERVAKGETITILEDGRPIARLVPEPEERRRRIQAAVEEMKRFRVGKSIGQAEIREMLEEGRR